MNYETRRIDLPMTTRAVKSGVGRLEGYAAIFNSPATIGDQFVEEVAPGAFRSSLAGNDVLALFNHNPGAILGRMSNLTLSLSEDGKGLAFVLDLPETTHGRDTIELVKRGDVLGMSFGFVARADEWDLPRTGLPRRKLMDVDLYEVSVVAMPAYPDTSVAPAADRSVTANLARRDRIEAELAARLARAKGGGGAIRTGKA